MSRLAASRARSDDDDGDVDDVHCSSLELCKPQNTDIPYSITIIIIIIIIRSTFDVCGSGDDYVDCANTMLHVKAKVTNEKDTDLAVGAAVGPVNLFLHSLFSQVDISFNGTLITFSTNTYPYRAMIETLLSYGMDAKTSQLTPPSTTKTLRAIWIAWISTMKIM